MNKGTGIAEQISPFYGTVIAEHSHPINCDGLFTRSMRYCSQECDGDVLYLE